MKFYKLGSYINSLLIVELKYIYACDINNFTKRRK